MIHVIYFLEVKELCMCISTGFGIVCRKSSNHPLQWMAAKSFYIAKRIKNKSERWNKSEEMQSDDMSD